MTNQPDTDATKGLTRDGGPRTRTRFDVSSAWIAEKTGYTRTGIYRFRTEPDTRPVTMARMIRFEETLGWSRLDQTVAASQGRWIEEFERVVLKAYQDEMKGKSK